MPARALRKDPRFGLAPQVTGPVPGASGNHEPIEVAALEKIAGMIAYAQIVRSTYDQ